jgi:hypothetical protein
MGWTYQIRPDVFSREFFHQLEDEINRARYEIDEKYHMSEELRLGKDIVQVIGQPMAKSLNMQGLSGKLTKLKHDVEFDAGKLAARIDSVTSRKDAAFSKGHQYLDATESHVGEVEQFVTELEAATGGNGE